MVCVEKDNIIYCEVSNYYIVGDNAGNGIKNSYESPSSITIIDKIDGKNIREIGWRSFANTKNIVNVTIKAKIVKINSAAFDRCEDLQYISIPSSCEEICSYGICPSTIASGRSIDLALTVIFEGESKLKKLGVYAIACRTKFFIYYCGRNSVTDVGVNNFYCSLSTASVTILSRSSAIKFANRGTISFDSCYRRSSICAHKMQKCSSNYWFIPVYLIFVCS